MFGKVFFFFLVDLTNDDASGDQRCRMASGARYCCCPPSFVLPFGFTWGLTPAVLRSFLSSSSPELANFPVLNCGYGGAGTLAWPGLVFEFAAEPLRLVAVEFSWTTLSLAVRNLYLSLCEMRMLRPK